MSEIELPAFSGPLDLLLHLIERNELDITAISLAKVAGQYLAEVERLKARHERIDQLMEFLVIGAQLMLIKSRALLPRSPVTIEEEEEEEDPAEALARRLRQYKQFKEAADYLALRNERGWRTYLRLLSAPKPSPAGRLDTSDVTLGDLHDAMTAVLARTDRLEESVQVAKKRTLTIEGQINRLRRLARSHGRFSFHRALSARANRAELSVTLLATLECIKRRELRAEQMTMFGPIDLIRRDDNDAETDLTV